MPKAFAAAAKLLLFFATLPFAVVAGLFGSAEKRSADEVAAYLRHFIEGIGGEWDWDDFISIPIADPHLESVRKRSAAVALPLTEQRMAALRELLVEVQGLGGNP